MKKLIYILSCTVLLMVGCSKDGDINNLFPPSKPQQPDTTLNIGSCGPQDFLFDAQELKITDHANINLSDRPLKDCAIRMHILGSQSVRDRFHSIHSELCLKYGVRLFRDSINYENTKSDDFIQSNPDFSELADLPTYSSVVFVGLTEHLSKIEIFADADWDTAHPAGVLLNDIIRTTAYDHTASMKALVAGEADYCDVLKYGGYEGLLSELKFDPNGLYESTQLFIFLTPPTSPGLYNITIRATFANGKVLENSATMDWTQNVIPPNIK